jgi:hypothetical protein
MQTDGHMKPSTATRKLAELRAKTDRQLVNLIAGRIEHAQHLLRVLDETPWQCAEAAYRRAEDAYREAARLAGALHTLPEIERHRLQAKLDAVRQSLDRRAAPVNFQVQAACS